MENGASFDREEILRDGIEEVVCNCNERLRQALGLEDNLRSLQENFCVGLGIELSEIEPILTEVGLQARMVLPKSKIGGGEVAEDVAKRRQGNRAAIVISLEMLEEVIAKPTVPGSEFNEINGVLSMFFEREVAEKRKD